MALDRASAAVEAAAVTDGLLERLRRQPTSAALRDSTGRAAASSEPVPDAEVESEGAILVARQHPGHPVVLRVFQQQDVVLEAAVVERAGVGQIHAARDALPDG